ncbi:hypothetical protein RND71_027657 [Anisodus tanguticus]|uniref:Trichome birefringence-like C-terminal domain-containing protein n=1 Tax=Anisodus tanguticus TaxID=243964 RepID=A0AAE1RH06_9SOLA|nr:hypothetical protein RND71_027657 [Anisodus tanguticus]
MNIETAYRKSILRLVDWIGHEVNMTKTHVVFRTYAPVHFRGGDWKTGGNCHLEKLPNIGSSQESLKTSFEYNTVINVLSEQQNKSKAWNLDLLNVTGMTFQRRDGHSSLLQKVESPTPGAPTPRSDRSMKETLGKCYKDSDKITEGESYIPISVEADTLNQRQLNLDALLLKQTQKPKFVRKIQCNYGFMLYFTKSTRENHVEIIGIVIFSFDPKEKRTA